MTEAENVSNEELANWEAPEPGSAKETNKVIDPLSMVPNIKNFDHREDAVTHQRNNVMTERYFEELRQEMGKAADIIKGRVLGSVGIGMGEWHRGEADKTKRIDFSSKLSKLFFESMPKMGLVAAIGNKLGKEPRPRALTEQEQATIAEARYVIYTVLSEESRKDALRLYTELENKVVHLLLPDLKNQPATVEVRRLAQSIISRVMRTEGPANEKDLQQRYFILYGKEMTKALTEGEVSSQTLPAEVQEVLKKAKIDLEMLIKEMAPAAQTAQAQK